MGLLPHAHVTHISLDSIICTRKLPVMIKRRRRKDTWLRKKNRLYLNSCARKAQRLLSTASLTLWCRNESLRVWDSSSRIAIQLTKRWSSPWIFTWLGSVLNYESSLRPRTARIGPLTLNSPHLQTTLNSRSILNTWKMRVKCQGRSLCTWQQIVRIYLQP